jgi:hypothetical protein
LHERASKSILEWYGRSRIGDDHAGVGFPRPPHFALPMTRQAVNYIVGLADEKVKLGRVWSDAPTSAEGLLSEQPHSPWPIA